MQQPKFQHNKNSPANGKYGDPAWDPAWEFYVENGGRAKDAPPEVLGGRGSTAANKKPSTEAANLKEAQAVKAAQSNTTAAASSSVPAELSSALLQDEGQQGAAAAAETGIGAGIAPCDTARYEAGQAPQLAGDETKPERHADIHIECILAPVTSAQATEPATVILSLTQRSFEQDWDAERKQLKYRESEEGVLFPIFMPSAGRARTARLCLEKPMESDWLDQDWGYVQIVCVKQNEKDDYMKHWPHLNFLVLPESANDLGIGASRFWITHAARKICPDDFQFIFMLDDNVLAWKAVPMHEKDGACLRRGSKLLRQPLCMRYWVAV